MHGKMQAVGVSLLVIAVGAAWLLNTMNVIPGVNWVWTVGLAASGVLLLMLGGINKLTVVVGPFLMVASVLSLLRQRGTIHMDQEVPYLVIALGVLLLLSSLSNLPRAGEKK
jgi:hypothetical protein